MKKMNKIKVKNNIVSTFYLYNAQFKFKRNDN